MKVPPGKALDIIYDEDEDFNIIENKIVNTGRWSILYQVIVHQLSTDKFYQVSYSKGATESQDEQPFEYEKEVEFIEVEPKEVTVIQYVRKEVI